MQKKTIVLMKSFVFEANIKLPKHMSKGLYLGPWAKNQKNKGTLLAQTLKVEEKKVTLFFYFLAKGPRYCHFLIFWGYICIKKK